MASGHIPAPPKSRLPGTEGKSITRLEDWAADADARLTTIESAPATPAAHAPTHEAGGTDPIPLDALAAPSDVTTLNATTGAHGLLPKLTGDATTFLAGDGTFTTPPGDSGTFPNLITGTTDVPANRHVAVPGRTVIDAGGKLRLRGNSVHRADGQRVFGAWDPDAPPEVPYSLDDEFNGTSLDPRWTAHNGGSGTGVMTTSVARGHLVMTLQKNAGHQAFVYREVPEGEWAAWVKIGYGGPESQDNNNTFSAGLIVGEDLSNDATTRYTIQLSDVANALSLVGMVTWSSDTAITTTHRTVPWFGLGAYLRIGYRPSDTTLFGHFSGDGVGWQRLFSLSVPTHVPKHVGLFDFHATGSVTTQVCFFDFIRFEAGLVLDPVNLPPAGAFV